MKMSVKDVVCYTRDGDSDPQRVKILAFTNVTVTHVEVLTGPQKGQKIYVPVFQLTPIAA